jgi:fibronectin type 3 domain-containing protein
MSLLFWVDPETSALTLLVDPEELPAGTYEWLSDFGTYSITVAARDRAGNLSLASTPVTVTLPAPALPAAAPNVTTEDRGLGIRVRWPRLTDAVSYQVWRAEDGAGLNAAPRGEPTAALSYLDILATNEADIGPLTWYYKVQGLNLDGPGPLSPNWVQGTASGVSAGWVLFGQMSGNFLEVGTIEADWPRS